MVGVVRSETVPTECSLVHLSTAHKLVVDGMIWDAWEVKEVKKNAPSVVPDASLWIGWHWNVTV